MAYSDYAAAVASLKTACGEAYNKYRNSCSHAVWYVLKNQVDPKTPYRDANLLLDHLTGNSGWTSVSVEEGWSNAQKGVLVIGGLKNSGGHGHVIAVYPGDKIESGGYSYSYKDKRTGKALTDRLRSHGAYPRALSTSIGSWPGAMSNGDKTVWDPWANDDTFKLVKFWTRTT